MPNHPYTKAEREAAFWEKVDKKGPDDCWLWMASTDLHGTKGGYGQFGRNGQVWKAHRLAYEYCIGPIPKGLFVLHSCDVKRCVNPRHLRVGTAKENTRDMMERERGYSPGSPGESHPCAKLTKRDVLNIRELLRWGKTNVSLAEYYGVDHSTISDIKCRNNWKHLSETDPLELVAERLEGKGVGA